MTLDTAAMPPVQVGFDRLLRSPELFSPRLALGPTRVDPKRVEQFRQLLIEDSDALPPMICVDNGLGQLLLADGHHRAAAYEQLPQLFRTFPVRILFAPAGQEPEAFAYEVALETAAKTARSLSRGEKRAAIMRLLAERPGDSSREIARIVGVSHNTVVACRQERGGQIDQRHMPQASPGDSEARATPSVRRITAQIARYGYRLASEEAIDQDDLVGELADRLEDEHAGNAAAWASWWQQLFADVRGELADRA